MNLNMNYDNIGNDLASAFEEGYTRGQKELAEKIMIPTINDLIVILKDEGISRKGISDGWHTFEELYYHRMILFSIILNQNKEISWKSRQHHDGTMFDEDSFICGIETPEGQYTYHYNLEFWDYFKVKELEFAPEYDGHKPSDITRLLSLPDTKGEVEEWKLGKFVSE